jgi:hypothetical protein
MSTRFLSRVTDILELTVVTTAQFCEYMKTTMVVHAYNPSTQEVEERGW